MVPDMFTMTGANDKTSEGRQQQTRPSHHNLPSSSRFKLPMTSRMNESSSTSQKHRHAPCYTSGKFTNETNTQTPIAPSDQPSSPVPGSMVNTQDRRVRPPPSLEKFRPFTVDPSKSNTPKRGATLQIDQTLSRFLNSGNARDHVPPQYKSRGRQTVAERLTAEQKRLREGSASMRQGRRAEPSRENPRDRIRANELNCIREIERRLKQTKTEEPEVVDLTHTDDSNRLLTVANSPIDDNDDYVTDSDREDGDHGYQENTISERLKYSSKPTVDRRSVSGVHLNEVRTEKNETPVIQISEGESEPESKNRLKRKPRKSRVSEHENVKMKQGVQNKEANSTRKKTRITAARTELRAQPFDRICDQPDKVDTKGWNVVSNPLTKPLENVTTDVERFVAGKDAETISLDDDSDDDEWQPAPSSPKPRSTEGQFFRKNVQRRSELLGSLSTSLKNGNLGSAKKRNEGIQDVSGSIHNSKDNSATLSEHIREERKNNVDTRKRSDIRPVPLSQIAVNSKRIFQTPNRNHGDRQHRDHGERIENVDVETQEVKGVQARKAEDGEPDIFDRTPVFSAHPDPLNLDRPLPPKCASPLRGKPTLINLDDDDPDDSVVEVNASRKNFNVEDVQPLELGKEGAEPEVETSKPNDDNPLNEVASPKDNNEGVVANVELEEVDLTLKATSSADVAPIEMSLNKVKISEPSDRRPRSPSFGSDSAPSGENIENDQEGNIRLIRLNEEELKEWASVTKNVKKSAVLAVIKEARISLCGRDFACLRACRWLNDEILNSFVALINARNREYFKQKDNEEIVEHRPGWVEDDGRKGDEHFSGCNQLFSSYRPRTHVFNTFFFERLKQNTYDYNGVRRWLHKAGKHIRDLDLILVPINIHDFHWVLAAIDLKHRIFVYMDSLLKKDTAEVIPTLRRWLIDEVHSKIGYDVAKHLDINNWKYSINPLFIPEQSDSGSCGVFTLYLADYLELGKKPDYSQKDIVQLRQRAVLFLKNGKLPDE